MVELKVFFENIDVITCNILDHRSVLKTLSVQLRSDRVEIVRRDHKIGMTTRKIGPELDCVVSNLVESFGSISIGNLDSQDLESFI